MTVILPYTIAEGDTTNSDKIDANFKTLETEANRLKTNADLATENKISRNTGYVIIGNTLICYGVTAISSAGTNITFPRAFGSSPTITAMLIDTNFWGVWTRGVNTTTATLVQAYTGASLSVHWIAIGINS